MCLVIVGEQGVGKSTFLKRYAEEHPPQRLVEGNVITITRPVIYISFPPSPTLKGAAETFLKALAGPGAARGSRTTLTHRIKEMLIDLKTELVIADEFQHVRNEGIKGRSEVADWLKDIVKTTNIPFVLSGMPETVQIIQADAQLHSLTEKPTILMAYDWENKDSRFAWRALLAKIDKQLPFNERSDLSEEETARHLFMCTGGNLRDLRKILHRAVRRALSVGGKLITWDDLAAGYEILPKASAVRGNPFDRNGLFK